MGGYEYVWMAKTNTLTHLRVNSYCSLTTYLFGIYLMPGQRYNEMIWLSYLWVYKGCLGRGVDEGRGKLR